MKTADLDLDTVYAVKSGGMFYRAVVLFPTRWRTVNSYAGGSTTLAGYAPETAPGRGRSIGARPGVPVLAAFALRGDYLFDTDDELRAAAAATRPVMEAAALPETARHIMLVQLGAILAPWEQHLENLARDRRNREQAAAARAAEQRAQDDARDRVRAVVGEGGWRFYDPPSRWTEFEALAVAYAAARTSPAAVAPPCCGGTGVADYAAVPCPDPACPVTVETPQ